MENKEKYMYKPKHNIGSKKFTSKEKYKFYTFMYRIYKELVETSDKLERVERWLKDFDGSEYAIVECSNLKKLLGIRSKEAIVRYDNRRKQWEK